MIRLISVVVPVYNVEDVLHFCIDSILNQTYKDFELILVDDGSTDKSGKICDEYADQDSRIRVFHKENGGVSSARNVGIDNANGEYICFVDSDDCVHTNFLEKMYTTMIAQRAKLVVCGYEVVQNGVILEKRKYSELEIDFVSRKNVYNLVNKTMYSAPWCKLFLKEIIIKHNIRFQEDLSLGEDMVFNFAYTDYISEIFILNLSLYKYIIDNNNSLLRRYRKDLLSDYQKMDKYLYEYLDKWAVSDECRSSYYQQRYYQYEDVLYNTFSDENKATFTNKIKYNNDIISSSDFKECIKIIDVQLNPIIKFSYKIQKYLPIYFYSRIRKVI